MELINFRNLNKSINEYEHLSGLFEKTNKIGQTKTYNMRNEKEKALSQVREGLDSFLRDKYSCIS